jgi:hypothetical protein
MSTTRMIARVALVAAALSTAGAATAAVTLPSKANHHAVTATANVTTGSTNSNDVHPASTPSPNEHATFGQCVAANAKTASDNGGKGWNPTMGCTKPNAPQNGANASSNASASTGLTNADAHANSHASAGLQKAATASATGEAHSH